MLLRRRLFLVAVVGLAWTVLGTSSHRSATTTTEADPGGGLPGFRYAHGVCLAKEECPECNNLVCQWSVLGNHQVCYQYPEGCASWGECRLF